MPSGIYKRVWLKGHTYPIKEIECPECHIKIQAKRKDTLCDACKRKHLKTHWKNIESNRDPIKRKDSNLKRNFGISLDDYKNMFERQDGCCAICGKHSDECPRSLDVDHSHTTGHIRGLLCNCCNQALGLFKDDVEILKNAIQYLSEVENG